MVGICSELNLFPILYFLPSLLWFTLNRGYFSASQILGLALRLFWTKEYGMKWQWATSEIKHCVFSVGSLALLPCGIEKHSLGRREMWSPEPKPQPEPSPSVPDMLTRVIAFSKLVTEKWPFVVKITEFWGGSITQHYGNISWRMRHQEALVKWNESVAGSLTRKSQ